MTVSEGSLKSGRVAHEIQFVVVSDEANLELLVGGKSDTVLRIHVVPFNRGPYLQSWCE